MSNNHYILYGTANCHLCEDAMDLIEITNADINVTAMDIVNDDNLYARYELTIPVLKNITTGSELNWPFNVESLLIFLANNKPTSQ